MNLRFFLPPNIAQSAPRDSIPVRVSIVLEDGQLSPPEKVPEEQLAALPNADRSAAFALHGWCNGKIASLIQLDRKKLTTLLSLLSERPSFYWANNPKEPIAWIGPELDGVSEYLQIQNPQPSASNRPATPDKTPTPSRRKSYADLTPVTVDGSSKFISITLPSREDPDYPEILDLVKQNDFRLEPSNRKWWLRDRHKTLNFLGQYWSRFENNYQAEFTKNFQRNTAKIKRAEINCSLKEETHSYEFQINISAGNSELNTIQRNLDSGRNYVEDEEDIYLIDQKNLQQIQTAQQNLTGDPNQPLLYNSTHRIPYYRLAETEEIIEAISPNFAPPDSWKKRSTALRDLSSLTPATIPPELDQQLRPYQRIGAAWLQHLFNNNLGGILADEMGLGKTVQALALILSLSSKDPEQTSLPTLIVCPASLLENWKREAQRFAPSLSSLIHHGSKRATNPDQLGFHDIIITSYGTLVRDQTLFMSKDLLCVIADEAQHAKNRRTLNAKALCSLQTNGRFVLTGTPIENSLDDLRSLFDFILPGAWQPAPSSARGEERVWHATRLKKFAAPYILRRTKDQVATDLPPKIEQIIYTRMTEQQATFYQRVHQQSEAEITALESKGASEGAIRMKTLVQLLRLRQTCCDPRLIEKTFPAAHSGKLAAFNELLSESIDDGHRILVFSQFVSLLTLLRQELEEQKIDYAYIDGKTKHRQAEVDRFNNDANIPLFLISLKAGGTGLNLTGADTVVHFDPWWNPAVEAQATDRAHRIGQTKIVTSYKLIMAGSIEEKVLQLQESKRHLLSDVFEETDAINSKISLEDLKELLK